MPIAGVEVKVSQFNPTDGRSRVVASAVSDPNGRAYFGGLKLGAYSLSVQMAGVGSDGAELEVADDDVKAEDVLQFGWPEQEIMNVRKLSGKLSATKFSDKIGDLVFKDPLVGMKLTLINAEKNQSVSTTVTDERGEFSFEGVPDALYVLHIAQTAESQNPWDLQGDILVQVKRDASHVNLPNLGLGMTSCGLTYRLDKKR